MALRFTVLSDNSHAIAILNDPLRSGSAIPQALNCLNRSFRYLYRRLQIIA